jgi:hypothetical protein
VDSRDVRVDGVDGVDADDRLDEPGRVESVELDDSTVCLAIRTDDLGISS